MVVDALDSVGARRILEGACEKQGIPMVHGAIAGWNGQVAVVMPGDRLMGELYSGEEDRGAEVSTGNHISLRQRYGHTGGGNLEAADRQGKRAEEQAADDGSASSPV